MADHRCYSCGDLLRGDERFVFVHRGVRRRHCSEACLLDDVRVERAVAGGRQRKWLLGVGLVLFAVVGGNEVWRRFHAARPVWISYPWPDVHPDPTPLPELVIFGPKWPPSDDDWQFAFAQSGWMYPLPGPARRAPKPDARIFGPEPAKGPAARCRQPGRCGVDLGGELWGEHVYAARDGVIDRVHVDNNQHPGGNYVRVSHFGGMAFTYYFHLAATPRGIARGRSVSAGDLIGLLGDTGTAGRPRHLHFALAVRPSPEFPEVYWDPTPLMTEWPLRVPANGTVAGLTPAPAPARPR
jgi:murein DD-endopeptidase MepM/ murein hydrolase activator NlpD